MFRPDLLCRSLGDSLAETVGVFAEPEQLVLNVTKHDRFVVIASDGVFEFITSNKVCISLLVDIDPYNKIISFHTVQ